MISSLLAAGLLLSAAATPAPGKVYVGLYLADVSALEVKQGRFNADLEVWLKWRGGEEPPKVSFTNGEIQSKELLSTESDGDWRSVRWRLQGAFRGTFPLHEYPFDAQTISIDVALPEAWGELVPDLAGSGMAEQFSITGWNYEPFFKAASQHRKVSSDFGSIATEGEPRRQSELSFLVQMTRPRVAYALKFLIPLGVILAMALLALVLPGNQVEVRGGIGVTALLSCVAFQFAAAEDIPNVSYLVTADKLFLGAYMLNLAALTQTIIAFMLWDKRARLSRRLDVFVLLAVATTAIAGSSMIVRQKRGAQMDAEVVPPVLPKLQTARTTLRIGVIDLPTLTSQGIPTLLRRGLSFEDEQGKAKPFLATQLPAMTNEWVRFLPGTGMSIQWNLRPGLRFSDGSALTAEDVVASVARLENVTRTRNEALTQTAYVIEYNDRSPSNLNTHIVYPSEEVQPFLGVDGGSRQLTELQRTKPGPGDGPYTVESFEAEKKAVFVPNRYFAGRPPAFERVELVSYPTSEALAAALASREIDIAPRVNSEALDALGDRAPHVVPWRSGGEDISALIPDLRMPLYRDLHIRQALVMAIDRQTVANLLDGSDAGVVPTGFRLPTAPDFEPAARSWPYDPQGARAVLLDGGYTLPVELKLVDKEQKAGKPLELQRRLQSQLEAGGFKVSWQLYRGTMPPEVASETHGGLRVGTRTTTWLRRLFNRKVVAAVWDQTSDGVSDERVIRDLERYSFTLFDERREVLSHRLQIEFADRLPIIPVAFVSTRGGRLSDLQGVKPPVSGASVYWNIEDWYVGEAAVDGGTR